ncbi:MAG: hypothetical protein IT366_22130 [Candidatus Hydrogenedentes bacterium]|nr:hypothetical protein [Candidatus Hydrogenedentota bacterium]
MDAIRYECPTCRHTLSIPAKYAGQRGACKHCGCVITVPAVAIPIQSEVLPTYALPKKKLEVVGNDAAIGKESWLLAPFCGNYLEIKRDHILYGDSREALLHEAADVSVCGINPKVLEELAATFRSSSSLGNLTNALMVSLGAHVPFPVLRSCVSCNSCDIYGYATQEINCAVEFTSDCFSLLLEGQDMVDKQQFPAAFRWPLCSSCYLKAQVVSRTVYAELKSFKVPLAGHLGVLGMVFQKAKSNADQKIHQQLNAIAERFGREMKLARLDPVPLVLPAITEYCFRVSARMRFDIPRGMEQAYYGKIKCEIHSYLSMCVNPATADQLTSTSVSDAGWKCSENRNTDYPAWKHIRKYPCNVAYGSAKATV